MDGSVDGNSTYSSNGPADGSTYSSNDSYGASPTKSQVASPTKSTGFGQVRAWSEKSSSKSEEGTFEVRRACSKWQPL
jgi:hypothetical protein